MMKKTKKGRPPQRYMVSEGDQLLINAWRTAHAAHSPVTRRQYERVLQQLSEQQPPDRLLDALSYDLVARHAAVSSSGGPRGASARSRVWYAAKSFAKWLVESGRVSRSTVAGILDHSVVTVPYQRKDPIPPSMIPKIFAATTSRRARMVALLVFFFGLRLGEFSRLKIGDLVDDGERLVVTVRAEIAKGKRSRRLSVLTSLSISAEHTIRSVLDAYAATHPPDIRDAAYLFRSPFDADAHMSYSTLSCDFEVACRRAGVRDDLCHCHAGRNTYTIMMAGGGVDMAFLADALGHCGLNTLWKYLKRPEDDRRQAIDRAFRTVFPQTGTHEEK